MIIVTSGARYIDIDAYACMVAYAELMRHCGERAKAASTAPWNESITGSLRSLQADFASHYQSAYDDRFIMVDVSDPSQFDPIVDPGRVIEVIDHHTGFEQHWASKLGVNCRIEFIGAAATLVYERWQARSKLDLMSAPAAELLAAAIMDNTLYFRAGVTTDRDRAAFRYVAERAGIEMPSWTTRYFSDCQTAIMDDFAGSVANDMKMVSFPAVPGELCIGQVVVWDAQPVLNGNLHTITNILGGMRPHWIANIVSISEGRSYFFTEDTVVQEWAEGILGLAFKDSIARSDRLWLRKEIIKLSQP